MHIRFTDILMNRLCGFGTINNPSGGAIDTFINGTSMSNYDLRFIYIRRQQTYVEKSNLCCMDKYLLVNWMFCPGGKGS